MTEHVKPSRDEIAEAMYEHRMGEGDFPDGVTEWDILPESWREEYREAADVVLALLPGRTEAEVKAEAWDEGYKAGNDLFWRKNPYRDA